VDQRQGALAALVAQVGVEGRQLVIVREEPEAMYRPGWLASSSTIRRIT
jgi:hypothetical protein